MGELNRKIKTVEENIGHLEGARNIVDEEARNKIIEHYLQLGELDQLDTKNSLKN